MQWTAQRAIRGAVTLTAAAAISWPLASCRDGVSAKASHPAFGAGRQLASEPDDLDELREPKLRRGRTVPPGPVRRPRPTPEGRSDGLRCSPDGQLGEWHDSVGWHEQKDGLSSAQHWGGSDDQRVRFALASYGSGLSVVVVAVDDVHVPARAAAALGQTDAVELELWPLEDGAAAKPSAKEGDSDEPKPSEVHAAVGVRLWLGSSRQLVRFDRPKESWRESEVSSYGAERADGWAVEARLPLTVLTPLQSAEVSRVRYRLTVHDADAEQKGEPTLRASGTVALEPTLLVPEAVRRRTSTRLCRALEKGAMWGFHNGWRCSVPYRADNTDDDSEPRAIWRLSHARLPEPPRLDYLRERVAFVNFPGLARGGGGLFDRHDVLHSVLSLGVVGAADPGNAHTRSSDAEPLRLPDGSWALVVTHARPAHPRVGRSTARAFGARCAAGHRVMVSIVAARNAPHRTPDHPVEQPKKPPFLEEVFSSLLEDCERSEVYDWELSRDHRTIEVRDVIHPARPHRRYVFRDGRYRRQQRDRSTATAAVQRGAR